MFQKHEDSTLQADAWNDSQVRQRDTLEELDEFAQWFETEQQKYWEANNVPKEQREELGLSKIVREQRDNQVPDDGVKRGNLSEARVKVDRAKETEMFSFVNIMQGKSDLWQKISEFYGIDEGFPSETLYA